MPRSKEKAKHNSLLNSSSFTILQMIHSPTYSIFMFQYVQVIFLLALEGAFVCEVEERS